MNNDINIEIEYIYEFLRESINKLKKLIMVKY